MNFPQFSPVIAYALLVWSLFWKGLALWKAAKQDQKYWFIVILILNTMGLLEIVYLFGFSKEKLKLSNLKDMIQGFAEFGKSKKKSK